MLHNLQYQLACRRAKQYDDPNLMYPAYVRKHFGPKAKRPVPKVVIGSGRRPGQPIVLMPAIHTPPPAPVKWPGQTVMVVSLVAAVLSFVFAGW